MNGTVSSLAARAALEGDMLARPELAAADTSRLLALAAAALLGPALHALAAGRLARLPGCGQQELGPARLLLLHTALVGLLSCALRVIPLAQWSLGVGALGEVTCRLGRAATDALYATQSILLTTGLLTVLTRPPGLLLAVLLLVIWLLGPGLNFGHVHWRVTAGAPGHDGPLLDSGGALSDPHSVVIDEIIVAAAWDHAASAASSAPTTATPAATTDRSAALDAVVAAAVSAAAEPSRGHVPLTGCAEEEAEVPLWLQSGAQAATAAGPLLLALPLLLLSQREPMLPVLAALGVVRAAGCLGQLLVLALAAGRPPGGLLVGTAGALRDAGLLLEAALVLVMYRSSTPPPADPVRVLVHDQRCGPSPPLRGARRTRARHGKSSAHPMWHRPGTETSSWTFSETW